MNREVYLNKRWRKDETLQEQKWDGNLEENKKQCPIYITFRIFFCGKKLDESLCNMTGARISKTKNMTTKNEIKIKFPKIFIPKEGKF